MNDNINLSKLICTERNKIAFYDCDYKARIKMSTILKLAAEVAGQDYTERGLGHRFLWDNGYVFLVSRMSVNIHRYPTQKEYLDVKTWECGKQGAMFLRGYDFVDEKGEVCIEAISGWIVVNPISRKIYRPSQFPWLMLQFDDKIPDTIPMGKIEGESFIKIGEHIVRIPDLDANGHLYNAFYADIAVEFMPTEIYERDLRNFRINFVNEAKLGDTIELFLEDTKEKVVVFGTVDGKKCFECEYIY